MDTYTWTDKNGLEQTVGGPEAREMRRLAGENERLEAAIRNSLRLQVNAERARIRRELLDEIDNEYTDLFTGTGFDADIVAAVRLPTLHAILDRICPEEG